MKLMNIFAIAFAAVMGLCSCGGGSEEKGSDPVIDQVKLSASPETFNFKAEGGEGTINVSSSREWSVFASNSEPWITVTPGSGASGSASVKVSVQANSTYEPREGEVTVKAGSERKYIKITQDAAEKPVYSFTCPLDGYDLAWNDEFNEGTELSSEWTHEVQKDHWVNNELQNYVNHKSPNGKLVTEIVDGKLHINCFKENGKIYSGRVYGKRNQGWKYGYVEASIKLPKGKGTWPAFWMMPVKFTKWPDDGEIDIMEEVGYHPNYVSSSLHATGHVHSNNTQVTKEVLCDGAEGGFHTYGMEWTPDYFQFYVDGKKTLYYKNPGTGKRDWPYDANFYVIFNLAWGGDWGGSQGVDESVLPITMEVDWVRVWQK